MAENTGGLFRKAALDRLSTPELLDRAIRVTPSWSWIALSSLIALLLGAALWSAVATVPVTVRGAGILIRPSGVADVVAGTGGRIETVRVRTGSRVRAGDPIAELSQPDIELDLRNARGELADARTRWDARRRYLEQQEETHRSFDERKRADLRQSIAFLEERVATLSERQANMEQLWDKRIINRERLIQARLALSEAQEELAAVRTGLDEIDLQAASRELESERERLEAEAELATLQRKADALEERLSRRTVVESPYAGTVVELKINPGEVVGDTTALVSVLPEENAENAELSAIVFVSPEDGKAVTPGMAAQVEPATVTREEHGFVVGAVETVSGLPATAEGMMRVLKNRQLVEQLSGGGAPFEVRIRLEADPGTPSGLRWSSSEGPQQQIRSGTPAAADIEVRSLRLASLAIPALEPILERHDPRPWVLALLRRLGCRSCDGD